MYLLQYVSNLGWVDTSEVGDGKSSLVEHSVDDVVLRCPASNPSSSGLLAWEVSGGEVRHDGVHPTRTYVN